MKVKKYLILCAVFLGSFILSYHTSVFNHNKSIFISPSPAFAEDDNEDEELLSPTQKLIIGSWTRYNNRTHILLIIRANGNWSSDLRVEGATSKIVERKGESSGTWRLEGKSLVFNITSTQMEDIWPTGTFEFEIVELSKKIITLKYPNARLITWKRARVAKDKPQEGIVNPVIPMKPVIVNLNKISSNEKDRYLCVALEVHLEELENNVPIPKLHPRAWDAAIMYLSSLMYNDVSTFDDMKIVTDKLTKILNPYFDGLITDINTTQVMISSSSDKIDEFVIEHSPPPPAPENPEGQAAAEGEDKKEEKSDK